MSVVSTGAAAAPSANGTIAASALPVGSRSLKVKRGKVSRGGLQVGGRDRRAQVQQSAGPRSLIAALATSGKPA